MGKSNSRATLHMHCGRCGRVVETAGETLQLGTLATTDVDAARRFFTLRLSWTVLAQGGICPDLGAHWTRPGAALTELGHDPQNLSPEILATVEHLHSGGVSTTRD
jgi:hypothetical protein